MATTVRKRKLVGYVTGIAVVGSIIGVTHASVSTAATKTQGAVVIQAIGAENEYADIIRQIGGPYVSVNAIMSDPNTDPHAYEASARTANQISKANLIVQNGLGYDDFMDKLESASPNQSRTVITVQQALGFPKNTPNPHLWYKRDTMPKVAQLVANALSKMDPSKASYFHSNVTKFDQSLHAWDAAIAPLKKSFPNAPVATTEPVADYLLQDLGLVNKTPWSFQAAVMNGTDPSAQDVQTVENLFKKHQVKAFVYNQQVVDSLTTTLLKLAKANHIPVVGVYETMPTHQSYQTWMINETTNIDKALKYHVSAETMS